MSGRLIAIGDIHGCRAALEAVLDAIQPSNTDTLVVLGDFVDRGPDSKGVINRLIQLSNECRLVTLQGNHEEMMLSVIRDKQPPYYWLQFGGVDTLDSYRFVGDMKVIPPEHYAFFDNMLDYFESDDHIFVHSNYDPQLELAKQGTQLLRWEKLTDNIPTAHTSGKRVILGHTHQREGEILDLGYLVCIDTFCYGGGWLTALDVHSNQLWQANLEGELRPR